jgi:uncharacterized protein (DUF2345 family)
MAENVARSKGRPSNYKLDRGGVPAEGGPFLGVVKSNIDPTRSGRLQVYIEAFANGGEAGADDESKWTTVSYLPSFFGQTPLPTSSGGNQETGAFPGNQTSYGMWFTPPDLGVTVMCVFANGDRSQGYYIGVVPDQGIGHMVPAIGAESKYKIGNKNQASYFENVEQLPVTEINTFNNQINNNPRFFAAEKPVQSVVAASMFQQGLIKDSERGPIRSSSQRETPSAVFGVSTPGVAIFQGGMAPNDIRKKLNAGEIKPNQAQVIGRVGGHSLLMDDGDLDGNNAMFRLRSSKGHQIMMNDTDNFFYFIHANGQTWMEFGVEGTVDIYSTNSVNVRTKGDINLHADRDINMFAGRNVNIKSGADMQFEATASMSIQAQEKVSIYSKATVGVKADGSLIINSAGGGWQASGSLALKGAPLDLNGASPGTAVAPNPITKTILDDTSFNTSSGWQVKPGALTSIVSRAPTHEPYPYHNKGVDVEVQFEEGTPSPPPGAEPVPAGVEISRTA